jgi:hypothetical protein
MASQTKTQPNSGFNRRLFLAGAAGSAMLPVAAGAVQPTKKKRGIYADPLNTPKTDLTDKVADFSYQNDVLAQLIVDMWKGDYANLLAAPDVTDYGTRSTNAKTALEDRGIYLKQPIVITEEEYEDGFNLLDANLSVTNGVVLVLPRKTRATLTTAAGPAPPLLETAKMLMAVTPNGI